MSDTSALPPQDEQLPFHALSPEDALERLETTVHGLTRAEAEARKVRFGPNALPQTPPPGVLAVFMRQFLSPLIYVLFLAAVVSLMLGEFSDAGFIFGVLLINAVIGTIQEYSAEQSALALRQMVSTACRVERDGDAYEIDAADLVPGDAVLLEPGGKVPADIRLLSGRDLALDESLLTGESLAVEKVPKPPLAGDTPLGDRSNMAFAGSMVSRGHGRGVVVATGLHTELGRIASAVLHRAAAKPPLVLRMERFTTRIAMLVGVAVLIMAAAAYIQGESLSRIFLLAVALAVSAIPEGLPVALTVALAIGMRRMARRNVIVRRLVAVESLGSCTFVASDKTGTLTVNELTVRYLLIPGSEPVAVTGEGMVPEGTIIATPEQRGAVNRLCVAAVIANDGFLGHKDGHWAHYGDAVDIALLVMAHKAGFTLPEIQTSYPELGKIPFQSELGYMASLNQACEQTLVFVKGAAEKLLPMCDRVNGLVGTVSLDASLVEGQAEELARQGYRVLALASGPLSLNGGEDLAPSHLCGLTLLGLVAMIDPLRTEVKAAIGACREAGIDVCMVTGDHPATAACIARDLDMPGAERVVTGAAVRTALADGEAELDRVTRDTRVYARVEPQQKLDIVQSLSRNGHFVAVTGDGANDAPALRAAHVGVAMGRRGTDVARETSELIITDDNFASIVAGVEEGRIAYANVRKVIFLLISTGAAELVLFTLALVSGLPLPLTAVQLLWLNLVTNGIQDVALAFEPGEGDELRRPPRAPKEPIFDRIMVERTLLSALVIGAFAFLEFRSLIDAGVGVDEARNAVLLLMVLFENVHVFNSRAEYRLALTQSPLRNPLLLFGTLIAQAIHIGAMHTPGLSDVLGAMPVSPARWTELLGIALLILLVMESHKLLHNYLRRRGAAISS
jgi:calcium-translocating P-type ATPase